jgi:hypothetical protein
MQAKGKPEPNKKGLRAEIRRRCRESKESVPRVRISEESAIKVVQIRIAALKARLSEDAGWVAHRKMGQRGRANKKIAKSTSQNLAKRK